MLKKYNKGAAKKNARGQSEQRAESFQMKTKKQSMYNNIPNYYEFVNYFLLSNYKNDSIIKMSAIQTHASILKQNCKYKIPLQLTNVMDKERERPRERRQKLGLWNSALRNGCISDEIRKICIKELKDSARLFSWQDESGEIRVFESNTKGTRRYSKRAASELRDVVGAIATDDREVIALTLTCDPSNYNNNRYDAWHAYTSEIQAVMNKLRKKYNAVYAWVKESTAKSYPHAHCVISLPRGSIPHYNAMANRTKIKYGDFYRYLKKIVKSPVIHCEKLTGDNVKHYLTKYITKQASADLYKMADVNYNFSDSDRKDIDCLLSTISTRTRQYGRTPNKKLFDTLQDIPKDKKEHILSYQKAAKQEQLVQACFGEIDETTKQLIDDVGNPLLSDAQRGEAASRLRRVLIKLCINSAFSCKREMHYIKFEKAEMFMGDNPEDKKTINPDEYEIFRKNGGTIGCKGCFFADFRELIINGYCDNLDYKRITQKGDVEDMFTPQNNKNDFVFINNVFEVLGYILTELLEKNIPYGRIQRVYVNPQKPSILQQDKTMSMAKVREYVNNL